MTEAKPTIGWQMCIEIRVKTCHLRLGSDKSWKIEKDLSFGLILLESFFDFDFPINLFLKSLLHRLSSKISLNSKLASLNVFLIEIKSFLDLTLSFPQIKVNLGDSGKKYKIIEEKIKIPEGKFSKICGQEFLQILSQPMKEPINRPKVMKTWWRMPMRPLLCRGARSVM